MAKEDALDALLRHVQSLLETGGLGQFHMDFWDDHTPYPQEIRDFELSSDRGARPLSREAWLKQEEAVLLVEALIAKLELNPTIH